MTGDNVEQEDKVVSALNIPCEGVYRSNHREVQAIVKVHESGNTQVICPRLTSKGESTFQKYCDNKGNFRDYPKCTYITEVKK